MLDLTVTEGLEILASAKTSREKIQLESSQGKCNSGMHNIQRGRREVGSRDGSWRSWGQIRCVLTNLTDKI
jgi:hypothetical protein